MFKVINIKPLSESQEEIKTKEEENEKLKQENKELKEEVKTLKETMIEVINSIYEEEQVRLSVPF